MIVREKLAAVDWSVPLEFGPPDRSRGVDQHMLADARKETYSLCVWDCSFNLARLNQSKINPRFLYRLTSVILYLRISISSC